MEGFKKCTNGHYYPNLLTECPYCPRSENKSVNANFDKTQISGMEGDFSSDNSKTQISGDDGSGYAKTQLFGVSSSTPKRDFSKTFIQDTEESVDGSIKISNIRPSRKITGWIISYTIDSMGIDFRIYEGSNTLGRDPENTITIPDDMSISGKHLTILSKKGRFYIKDEMAANGTFINNQELEVGIPFELKDGDDIKLGTTIFKFRTSI